MLPYYDVRLIIVLYLQYSTIIEYYYKEKIA